MNKSDKFDSSNGQLIIKVFSDSGYPSNSFSNDPILSKLSNQTQKCLINSKARKRKDRDEDIKSSNTSIDEEISESNIKKKET